MSSATTDAPIKADPIASFTMLRGPLVGMASLQHTDETRDVLCATHISLRSALGGQIILHATDGKIAARMTTEVVEEELFAPLPEHEDLLVDLSGVKDLPKLPRKGSIVRVDVYAAHVEFAAGDLRYVAKRQEQREGIQPFPVQTVDKILSDKSDAKREIHVNGELLAKVLKAAEQCSAGTGARITRQTDDSVRVEPLGACRFAAVLMLLRDE